MIKFPNIFILAILALAGLFQACESYTELDPSDMVGNNQAFKDVTSVNRVMTGAYSIMSLRESMGVSEYIADDLVQGSDAGGAGTNLFGWTYVDDGESGNIWSRQYRIINNANRILHQSASVTPKNEEEEKILQNAFGQAYFLRAYAHFELLRFFSDFSDDEALGIPYVSYPHVLGFPSRDKVGECYDYMMKDLDKSYNLIPETQSNKAYATRSAVQALRARICLYHKQYVHAYVYATDALRMNPMESAEDFSKIWDDKTDDGVILKLPRAQGQSQIGSLFIGGDNSSIFRPSLKYMNVYPEKDIRSSVFFGKGPDRSGNIVDRVHKYSGTSSNIGLNDEKVFRSAEMKLIEIETLIHQDRLEDANKELNLFRTQRISEWNQVNYTKDQIINEILLERRRELAFENHRFFDLRRYKLPIVRDNGKTLDADHFRMLMPIPKSELQANENIRNQQNPGY